MESLSRILFGVVNHKTGMELRKLIEINANDFHWISYLLANQTKVIFTEFGREEDNQLKNVIDKLNKTLTGEIMPNNIAKAITLLADTLIQFELDATLEPVELVKKPQSLCP